MPVILWGVLAVAAGLAFMSVIAWRAAASRPALPVGVELPTTSLQHLARGGLAVGVLLAGTAAGIVIVHGPAETYANDVPRLTFTALMLAVLAAFVTMLLVARSWEKRDDGRFDERDKAILDRAHMAQAPAMLLTLAVWMVGLTEAFRGTGVPTFYLYLVFWSVLAMNLIALPIGILIGYRRR
jgi:cytochrome bd-type quinol oxidase subunit 2